METISRSIRIRFATGVHTVAHGSHTRGAIGAGGDGGTERTVEFDRRKVDWSKSRRTGSMTIDLPTDLGPGLWEIIDAQTEHKPRTAYYLVTDETVQELTEAESIAYEEDN